MTDEPILYLVTIDLAEDPDELSPDERSRMVAAATVAAELELIRIHADRDRAGHVRLVAHTPDVTKDSKERDKEGHLLERGGTADVLLACPDCTRGLIGADIFPKRDAIPVRICTTLAGVTLPAKLVAKATAHDVFACGLDPQGVPLKVG